MKIKKFLEKVAEEDRESHIDEKDIEFLASVGVDYNKKREEDKKQPPASYYLTARSFNYKAFLISASCFLLAAVALVLILYYSLKPSSVDPPFGYLDLNKEYTNSSLQELNKELVLFFLSVDESEYNVDVTKYYDKLSNDSLYYSIFFSKSMLAFKIDIVVNNLYEYEKAPLVNEIKHADIYGYTLNYFEVLTPVEDLPISEALCRGEIQIGQQWLYITNYTELVISEQTTFVQTISSLISIK